MGDRPAPSTNRTTGGRCCECQREAVHNKERSDMSTVERMGSCLRALAVGGVLLVGGAMIAGTAGADGFEAVNTCLDSGNLSLMEADEATVTQSLTQADDASGNMSLTDADERSGNVGMTAIEE